MAVFRTFRQLKLEGQRAFLEQALNAIKDQNESMSRYLKFVFASTMFLKCSRYYRFNIYRLVLSDWKQQNIEVTMIPFYYDRQQFLDFPPETFQIGEELALRMIALLKPRFVSLHYNSHFHTQDKREGEFFETIIQNVDAKIAVVLQHGLESIVGLLEQNASKITELTFVASHLPNAFVLPAMRLEICYVKGVQSMSQLKTLLQQQAIKKLRASFDVEGNQSEAAFAANLFHETINDTVKQVELSTSGTASLPVLQHLVRNIRTFFPRLQNLQVESWIECFQYYGTPYPELAAELLLEFNRAIQNVDQECGRLPLKVQSKFDFHLYLEEMKNLDWTKEFQENERLKHVGFNLEQEDDKLTRHVSSNGANSTFDCTFLIWPGEFESDEFL